MKDTPRQANPLALYEDFQLRTGRLLPHAHETLCYVSPDSLHSGVSKTAYGTPQARWCVRLSGGGDLGVAIDLENVPARRHYLKINCVLEQWRLLSNDLEIRLNGRVLHACETEFVENICQGWPSLYYDVPLDLLREGENEARVATRDSSGAGLLVSEIAMVSLPAPTPGQQLSCLRAARVGQAFTVALALEAGTRVRVQVRGLSGAAYTGCTVQGARAFVHFEATEPGPSRAQVCLDGKSPDWVTLDMPEIVPASGDRCLVGMDSDDHRHDLSSEAERVLEVFAMTGMGDFVQFRPSHGRTHVHFAPVEAWQRRVDFLRAMRIRLGMADTRSKLMGFFPDMAGDAYVGCHVHEPYLYFALHLENTRLKEEFQIDARGVLASESFGQSEALYQSVLDRAREKHVTRAGRSSVGSPSLLCVYEAKAGFERLTLEPVSNVNLLIAAGRGVTKAPCQWGAHVPLDWYFGGPTDACKSRKFRLALHLLYMAGAQYLYAENSLFKTNAFSREDWESPYCITNRQYLRDFYEYVTRNPREGRLVVKKAVIYGRHEHFYWYHDDRMAEMAEMRDWDLPMWGKWADGGSRRCWRALDAWLPVAPDQHTAPAPYNKDLFSGTPYGDVDIIAWDDDYARYETLALLGWNTMCPDMLERLMAYVAQGGTLLFSYCHLSQTDRSGAPMAYIRHEGLSAFLGGSPGQEHAVPGGIRFADGYVQAQASDALRAVAFSPDTAAPMAWDAQGNGVLYCNPYGKGRVFFATFAEYFAADWGVDFMRHVLEMLGSQGGRTCSNPAIAFAERLLPDGSRTVQVLNMNCAAAEGTEPFRITIEGHEIRGSAPEGRILTYSVPG